MTLSLLTAKASALLVAVTIVLATLHTGVGAQTSAEQELARRSREYYLRSERSSQFIWRQRRDMPEPRSDFAHASLPGTTSQFITGGCAGPCLVSVTSTVWLYNPTTDDYLIYPPLSNARCRHGSAVVGNAMITFGGVALNDTLANTTEVFDLNTNQTTVFSGGIVNQLADFVYFVSNNKLFVVGGYDVNAGYVAQTAIYQYITGNVWNKVGDLAQSRGDAFVAVVLGTAYVVGGWTSDDNFTTPLGTMEMITPNATGVNVAQDPSDHLSPPRGDASFCNIRGRLFVFGGENPSWSPLDQVNVLSLDYSSKESQDWHYAGELPTKRYRFGCGSLTGNSVHLFGGQDIQGNTTLPSARVDEFVEQRIFENIGSLLPTNAYISGAASVAPWIWTAAHVAQTMARSPVRVQYRAIETSTAQSEFSVSVPNDNMYIGDGPLSSGVYSTIQNLGHAIVQIPLATSAVRIVYSLSVARSVAKITPCGLARAFSGKSLLWRDLDSSMVPTTVLDLSVTAYRQALNSSLTIALVAYLTQACPNEFNRNGFNALPELASRTPSLAVEGGITYSLKTFFAPALPYQQAAIQNAAGNFSSPDTADLRFSLPSGLNNLDVDLSSLNFLNAQGFLAYPVVVGHFAYVRQDQTFNAQTGPLVKAFLSFLLGARGQAYATSFGFGPLSPYWHDVALAAVDLIKISADASEYVIDQVPEPDFSLLTSCEDLVLYNEAVGAASLDQLQNVLEKAIANQDRNVQLTADTTAALAIAIIGLLIALVACILAIIATCKLRNRDGEVNGMGNMPPSTTRSAKFSNNASHVPGIGDGLQVV